MFGEQPTNAFHFIKCPNCNYEFQSAFSGAVQATGCTEQCPRCLQAVATPSLFGNMSFEPFKEISRSPFRTFDGLEGYIYNGHIQVLWRYTQSPFAPVVAMFHRNIEYLMNDIQVAATAPGNLSQTVIYGLVTATMTSLERLVRDVFAVLHEDANSTAQIPSLARFSKWGPTYISRYGDEFSYLFVDEGHFRALRFLSAYRNCVVHTAGIVDDQTIKLIQDHPDLHLHRRGGPLPIDLETVVSLADSVTQWAEALIKCSGVKIGLASS